jgi:hypothetical protein
MLTDVEGKGALLHYYIGHAAQERQLNETGFTLLECLDADGQAVPSGRPGKGAWLYYVASPAAPEHHGC